MLAASVKVLGVETRDDLACVGGSVRLADLMPHHLTVFRATFSRSGDHTLTLAMPLSAPGADTLLTAKVLRVKLATGDFDEWDIRRANSTDTSQGRVVVVTAKPWLHRLAKAEPLSQTLATGVLLRDVTLIDRTPEQLLDVILAHASANGYAWLGKGTVGPTTPVPVYRVSRASPLAALRQLEVEARGIVWPRANGTTGYLLDLLDAVNSTDEPIDLVSQVTVREAELDRDDAEFANRLYASGRVGPEGPATIADAVWLVSAKSGNTLELTDPAGGPSPVQVADQLNGLYLRRETAAAVEVAISAASMVNQTTLGVRVTVASTTGFTVGRLIEAQGGGTYAAMVYQGTVTSVDAGNSYVWFRIDAQSPAAANLSTTVYGPELPLGTSGAKLRGFPVYGWTDITDSSKLNATTAQVVVTNATGITVGDLLSVRRTATGNELLALEHPASIATYGGPNAVPSVGDVDLPEYGGVRNYLPEGFFRTWTDPAGPPSGWTWEHPGTGWSVTRETSGPFPLLAPYVMRVQAIGQASVNTLGIATPTGAQATSRIFRLVSDPITPDLVPEGTFYVVVMRAFAAALLRTATIRLGLKRKLIDNLGTALYWYSPVPDVVAIPPDAFAAQANPDQVIALAIPATMATAPVDMSTAGQVGVSVVVEIEVLAQSGILTATQQVVDVYLGPIMLVRARATPEGFVEYAEANALWHETNNLLVQRASPLKSYRLQVRDLHRRDGAAFSAQQLKIGRRARLHLPSLGVTGAVVDINEISPDYRVPEATEVQFDSAPRKLRGLLTGTVGATGAPAQGGAGTTAPGGGGVSSGPGSPPPTTSTSAAPPAVVWVPIPFYVGETGQSSTLTNLPNANTERDAAVRVAADLRYATECYLSVYVATQGAAGSKLVVRFSANDGSSWNYLDGQGAPAADLGSVPTGGVVRTGTVALTDAAKGPVLLGLFEEGGDGTADPVVGNVILWVKQTSAASASGGGTNYHTPTSAGCPTSGTALGVEDFSGYADSTALFTDVDSGARALFGIWYGDASSTVLETLLKFFGHNVLKAIYSAAPTAEFGGWYSYLTFNDDYTGQNGTHDLWVRKTFKIESGFTFGTAGREDFFDGLTIFQFEFTNSSGTGGAYTGSAALCIRNSRVYLDVTTGGDKAVTYSIDLGASSLVVGATNWKDAIVHLWSPNHDGVFHCKVWLQDACATNQQPTYALFRLPMVVKASTPRRVEEVDNWNYNFSPLPTSPGKYVLTGRYEWEPGENDGGVTNPYGVAEPTSIVAASACAVSATANGEEDFDNFVSSSQLFTWMNTGGKSVFATNYGSSGSTALETVDTFDSHGVLKQTYSDAPTALDGGWEMRAYEFENNTGQHMTTDLWVRLTAKVEGGFTTGSYADADHHLGLRLIEALSGNTSGRISIVIRNGSVFLDANGSALPATSVNLGPASLLIGASGYMDVILHAWESGSAGSGVYTMKAWVHTACQTGQSPLGTISGLSLGVGTTLDQIRINRSSATLPTSPGKWIQTGRVEYEFGAGDGGAANPYGVGSPS
jgi:hypothetical protein